MNVLSAFPKVRNSEYPDLARYNYVIEKELGRNITGGRATYQGINILTGKSVVIKKFQFIKGSEWSEYEAIEKEINVLQNLNSPKIPRYLDRIETPTGLCLVTEYKNAPSLDIKRNFTLQQIKEIAIGVLEILVYLQQQNPPLIHRDIKPENILVKTCKQLEVYLVDFGFANINGGEVAASSVVKGTLGFMPPEQILNRQLNPASDLYSLGITLICTIARIKSTEIGKIIDDNFRIDFKQIQGNSNKKFLKWLKKMVALKVKERYADAIEALEQLKSIEVEKNDRKTAFKKQIMTPIVGLTAIGAVILGQAGKITDWQKQYGKQKSTETAQLSQLLAKNTGSKKIEMCGANFQFADLAGFNLSNANLELANFRGANLEGANLDGANLKSTDLREANLKNASLKGTNLENADLEEANLYGVDLANANLKNSKLWGVNLEVANLKAANLTKARLWDASLRGTNLNNANLFYANFRGADLRGANLKGVNLKFTYFRGAIMPDGRRSRRV